MNPKSFTSMILAAGFGTRMQPLTHQVPKPLIEINNISLLQNSIDLLFKIGCKKIVINTHYKNEIIQDFIKKKYNDSNIIISHEEEILDTGGGVKNAISLFDDKDILITNSDIFWHNQNENDIIKLLNDYEPKEECRLLLIEKEKSHGHNKKSGDFSFKKDDQIKRWEPNEKIFYYAGIQIISLDILKNINSNIFSFNKVWDNQIAKNSIYGNSMSSEWYHVGDFNGLKEAINLTT